MKISDIVLIIILLIFSVAPILLFPSSATNTAVITVDNEPYKTVNLDKDETFIVKTKYGENTIEIKNHAISVTDADCKDKICVNTGAINKTNEVIACAPHKVLIEIRD